jgi:micrococcal nuclease
MSGPSGFTAPKFALRDPRLWYYRAYVIRVVDGDTAILYTDKGTHEYSVMKVRLAGIDAPELRPREGSPEQRAAEKVLAAKATNRLKELIEGREIILRTEKTGKFGRWLGRLYLPDEPDVCANDLLLEEGLAVRYGDPRPWRNE